MSTCLSLKWPNCLSLKKGNLFVHQKGQPVSPHKRSTSLSFKNVNLFFSQKGQPVCPSKRSTYMPIKKVNLYVPQKSQPVCLLKRATCLSVKMFKPPLCQSPLSNLFVRLNWQPVHEGKCSLGRIQPSNCQDNTVQISIRERGRVVIFRDKELLICQKKNNWEACL